LWLICEVIMSRSNGISVIFCLLVVLPGALRAQTQAAAPEKTRPALPNYVELTPRIGTGGQPGEGGLKQLAEKGYQYVVNIRASSEEADFAAEEKQAMDLGLRYYMVPFSAREPSEGQALAFVALMAALKDSKVFIHCGSGNRVGGLLMVYFAVQEGMPPEMAEAEAKKAGLRSTDLLEFARRVIARQRK
jgi:uncharacterized protein (TIGR01244 family)